MASLQCKKQALNIMQEHMPLLTHQCAMHSSQSMSCLPRNNHAYTLSNVLASYRKAIAQGSLLSLVQPLALSYP